MPRSVSFRSMPLMGGRLAPLALYYSRNKKARAGGFAVTVGGRRRDARELTQGRNRTVVIDPRGTRLPTEAASLGRHAPAGLDAAQKTLDPLHELVALSQAEPPVGHVGILAFGCQVGGLSGTTLCFHRMRHAFGDVVAQLLEHDAPPAPAAQLGAT